MADALHSPLGTAFVVALLMIAATAGIVAFTQAPLVVGSVFGVVAGVVLVYWAGWGRP